MPNSGKWLEQLVADIEKTLLPHTFSITTNEKIFDATGMQTAEFDIVIEGDLGSTSIRWLIECRDRPSAGAAPGEWILGLIGRRDFHRFDKVTAVSTTGFSPSAVEYAKGRNIDLRTVENLTLKSIADWFGPTKFTVIEHRGDVVLAEIILDGNADQSTVTSAMSKVALLEARTPFLVRTDTSETINIANVWQAVLNRQKNLFEGLAPNGETKRSVVHVNYGSPDSRYQIMTESGPVHVVKIIFHADLHVESKEIAISQIVQYSRTLDQKSLAQSVRFELEAGDQAFDLAFHNFGDNDKTFIRARARPSGENRRRTHR